MGLGQGQDDWPKTTTQAKGYLGYLRQELKSLGGHGKLPFLNLQSNLSCG
jgi:hypothetical protein